jgi:hypothetical protein
VNSLTLCCRQRKTKNVVWYHEGLFDAVALSAAENMHTIDLRMAENVHTINVTRVLKGCYKCGTRAVQGRCKSVTRVSKRVTRVL